MELLLILILVVSVISVTLSGYVLLQSKAKNQAEQPLVTDKLSELAQQLTLQFQQAQQHTSDANLRNQKQVHQLEKELSTKMATLQENQKQSLSIAEELRGLQRILKSPTQRGALGEYFLESALKNVLAPNLYSMEYSFKGGERADAVIHYADKLIPIDAKFSLENYNRLVEADTTTEKDKYERAVQQDIKKRIDETSKYVQPNEGTFEFALMFIPSEALYYELIVKEVGVGGRARNLIEYAHEKKVIPVSPVVFYAYLQTILQGVRQLQFSKNAEAIQKRAGALALHLKSYEEYLRKVGVGMSNATKAYNKATKEFQKVEQDLVHITDQDLSE